MVGAACLECDEPAAEPGELIGRQLGDNFGDFFDFHVAQYSTAGAWLSRGRINVRPPMSALCQKQTFRGAAMRAVRLRHIVIIGWLAEAQDEVSTLLPWPIRAVRSPGRAISVERTNVAAPD